MIWPPPKPRCLQALRATKVNPDDCPSETMNSARIDLMLLRWKREEP